MKKILLGLIILSTVASANPFCITKDFVEITKITKEVNEKRENTDKKVVSKGLEKLSHVQAKHNKKLTDDQKQVFKKAEALFKKYSK